MSIREIFDAESRHQREQEKKLVENTERAADLYQIREYESQLWLTFNGNLICPCSMLNDEPVVALNVMRKMYVERNTK